MASSYWYCDNCGASNKSDAKTCSTCGKSRSNLSPSLDIAPRSSSTGHFVLGHILNQRFRILSILGEGGMGAVYKAEDLQLGKRLVAVKEMGQNYLNAQEIAEAAKAFEREALMLANLRHPNLPRIYDHFADSGRWYIVMDFIEGETLDEHVNKEKNRYLSIEKALDVGLQLCGVLGYLHSHEPAIIFRDLKPDNVMLTPEGHLYLIDFGIARHFKMGKANDTSSFVSLGYAAPEQYGQGQTTPRADIYSLGVTLYYLLSGHDPSLNTPTFFDFPPLRAQSQKIPNELEILVAQMLDKDASKRPTNMAALRGELEHIQKLQRIAAQPGLKQKQLSPLDAQIVDAHQSVSIPLVPLEMKHAGLVWTIVWSPDGMRMASSSEDKTVQIWDMITGKSLLTYREHGSDEVRAVSWSPDGTRLASGGWDKTVKVWNAATGKSIFTYYGHTDYVRALAWSPDGKYVASAGKDKTVQIWDAATGTNIYTYNTHKDTVIALAWSPDGTHLASGSQDKTVWVWKATTGDAFFTYVHALSVYSVAWSPDGKYIASASEDKTVQVWDTTQESRVFTYAGHSRWVYAIAWSPDSKYLASTSKDKFVHVWKATTGNIVTQYPCRTDQVYAVSWSPDGKRIAYSDGRSVQVKLLEESFEQIVTPKITPISSQIKALPTLPTGTPKVIKTKVPVDDIRVTSTSEEKITQEISGEKNLEQVSVPVNNRVSQTSDILIQPQDVSVTSSTHVTPIAPPYGKKKAADSSTVLLPDSKLPEEALKDFFLSITVPIGPGPDGLPGNWSM